MITDPPPTGLSNENPNREEEMSSGTETPRLREEDPPGFPVASATIPGN